jgi:hypothetical protein
MDIYSPAVLNRVVQDLKSTVISPFLLNRFFGEVSLSTNSDTIYFDTLVGKPRLAPFVLPTVEGQIVESLGYVTNSFKPAYIKDKRVHEAGKAVKRAPGMPIGAPLSTAQIAALNLAADSEDQIQMVDRRLEVMAAEVLRTGKVTVTGEKYPTTVVDFGRDAALTVTLTSTARWNDAAPTPVDNLETWAGLIRDKSGSAAVDVIMANNVFSVFRKDDDVKELLDKNKNLSPRTNLDGGPTAPIRGAQYKGQVGDFDIWVYADSYVDENGAGQKYLPDDYLLMVGPELEGVRHFGQIKDEEAGYQALDYYQKSWIQPDPSIRYLMLQSAPLVVPYRVNASLSAKVL